MQCSALDSIRVELSRIAWCAKSTTAEAGPCVHHRNPLICRSTIVDIGFQKAAAAAAAVERISTQRMRERARESGTNRRTSQRSSNSRLVCNSQRKEWRSNERKKRTTSGGRVLLLLHSSLAAAAAVSRGPSVRAGAFARNTSASRVRCRCVRL